MYHGIYISRSLTKDGWAPHLARFSRDVGFHCSFPLTLDSTDALSGQPLWYPTSREKRVRCGAPVPLLGNQGTMVGRTPRHTYNCFLKPNRRKSDCDSAFRLDAPIPGI